MVRTDKDLIALENHRAKVAAELAADRKALAEMGEIRCAFCREPIGPGVDLRRAWPEVTGYAPPRTAGGTNALAFQRKTGRFVHDTCGSLRRLDVAPDQTSLL